MEKKKTITKETANELIGLLNQALRIEYTFVIHYPRIAQLIKDEETRKMVLAMCEASIHHADVVAGIITHLKGNPDWSFDLFPEGKIQPLKIFQIQLEKEKQALKLHRKSAGLISATSNSNALYDLANEEENHIQMVSQIIQRLKQG